MPLLTRVAEHVDDFGSITCIKWQRDIQQLFGGAKQGVIERLKYAVSDGTAG